MGVLDDFLSSGQDEIDVLFGRSTMVCNGQTFFVVMNMSRKSYEGALGGLESQIQSVAVAQARTSPTRKHSFRSDAQSTA